MNSEARLLLIMGAFVLLGAGGMVLVNRTPSLAPDPAPTPIPLAWNDTTFKPLIENARHMRGDAKAQFTIVEFGDLECPSCRHAYNFMLTKLDKEISFQFYFHHYPLLQHHQAMGAAVATEAAGRQGKFWPMFDALYGGEKTVLSPDLFDKEAREIGLDMRKFEADRADPALDSLVQSDHNLGDISHVFQTPTFIVHDKKSGQYFTAAGSSDLDKLMSRLTGKPILDPSPVPTP